MWTRCSENPPPSAAQDGGWGRPTAGGAWGAAPVACGSVASFPLEFLTHIPARPPPPLPDHSSSRQGPQLSKPRVYTPSPPPTHTQSRVVSFLQGTRVGFWLPSLRPLLSNSTQLSCGCCSSPPSDHEVPGTHAPGTLGGLVSQQCEPWAGGVFTPRACLASPDWVCRAGTAV